MEHGTPAHFVLTDDGWEANPVSVRKSDRVHSIYERTLNADTLSELDTEFSGEVIPLDHCYSNDLRWDKIDPNPQVRWGEIIEKFNLRPIEAVTNTV